MVKIMAKQFNKRPMPFIRLFWPFWSRPIFNIWQNLQQKPGQSCSHRSGSAQTGGGAGPRTCPGDHPSQNPAVEVSPAACLSSFMSSSGHWVDEFNLNTKGGNHYWYVIFCKELDNKQLFTIHTPETTCVSLCPWFRLSDSRVSQRGCLGRISSWLGRRSFIKLMMYFNII